MKRLLAALVVTIALSAPAAAPAAPDEYDESQSHPLRIAAYAVHPVGVAVKWLVVWPLHYLVSRSALEQVFGHVPHDDYAFDEEYL